jgi:hypothetical protein
LLQTKWKSTLDSLLKRPMSSSLLLTGISLVAGDNVINHRLDRVPQGWLVVDTTAAVSIYRAAPMNLLTLTLNASAPSTVSLLVF